MTQNGDRISDAGRYNHLSEKVLDEFHDTVQHLWIPPTRTTNGVVHVVDVLETPPSPLVFCRDYVSKSRPCIIRNAILNKNAAAGQQDEPTIVTLDDVCSLLSVNGSNSDDSSSIENSNSTKTDEMDDTDPLLLTVDVTPDGYGDCVRTVVVKQPQNDKSNSNNDDMEKEVFVQPKEVPMTLIEFRDRLRQQEGQSSNKWSNRKRSTADGNHRARTDMYGRPILLDELSPFDDSSNGIVYYSRQNDCLRKELPMAIQQLFPTTFDWAEEVFQTSLEAVNLWMGNEASVSSMHKDHYENLFYVASGEKIFWVCPPCDVPFLYEHRSYPSRVFVDHETTTNDDDTNHEEEEKKATTKRQWRVRRKQEEGEQPGDRDDDERVHWIAPDVSQQPLSPELLERYPLLPRTHPMEIRVQQGELLYLPALWYHRVTQSCETVAVNYWYDMQFESPHWCYFSLLQQLHDEAVPPRSFPREETTDANKG